MSEQHDMSPDKNACVGSMCNINPIDILMYLLSKWYWFVLSIACSVAMLGISMPRLRITIPVRLR